MTARTKEQIQEYVRTMNKAGHSLTRTVVHQLLDIAGNDISAAGFYHSEYGKKHKEDDLFDPNQKKEEFIASVDKVLQERVGHAYMLPPEQRQAAELFRAFRNYAEGVNWGDGETFSQLSQKYHEVVKQINSIVHAADKRISDLRLRRQELMHSRGLPYKETAL